MPEPLSPQALQEHMLQGWAVQGILIICSLLLSGAVFGILYAFGKDGLVIQKRRWIVVAISSLMAYGALSLIVHVRNDLNAIKIAEKQMDEHTAKQMELVDNELAAIRTETLELSKRGLKADVLAASGITPTIQTNSTSLATVGGAPYSPLNRTIESGINMAFVLRVSNSGRPTTAWGWRASIVLPDGKEIPAIIPQCTLPTNSGAFPTVIGPVILTKENNMLEALSFNPLATGAGEVVWLVVHVNGLEKPPEGSHFIITFEDVYGRQTKIDHPWTDVHEAK
jgi:hypothetical protein